jgi:hypothetical protein
MALANPAGSMAFADPVGLIALVNPAGSMALADPVGLIALVDPAGSTALADHLGHWVVPAHPLVGWFGVGG